jgi:hypothetical protein
MPEPCRRPWLHTGRQGGREAERRGQGTIGGTSAPVREGGPVVQTGAGARRWRRRARPLGVVARVLALAAVLHFLVLPQIGGTRRAIGLLADLTPLLVGSAVVVEGWRSPPTRS